MLTFRRVTEKLLNKSGLILATFKSNTISLISKRDFVIIAFFTLLGAGGVFAAALITITASDSQGAAYVRATACDENVTIRAITASDAATGQLYVATIALSDISQNASTGCGNKTMQIALKINDQMRYATWDIQSESTDSTFYLTGATSSLSDYYADTLLSPFQADGLTNVAIANIGSFTNTYTWSQTATSGAWWSITSSSDGTKLAAVVYEGYIWTSTDSGATWIQRTASGIRLWTSVTSSSDGTKLAAVAYVAGGYSGYIYTSTDSGATWIEQTASGSRQWQSITSSSDGTKLAAGVYGGHIYTSNDSGETWTERQPTAGVTRAWRSITSSSDGTKLAAVFSGSGYIYTSTDSGVNWTRRTTDAYRNWYSITSSSDGTKLAAVVLGGYIWASTDSGVNWTTNSNSSGFRSWRSITSSSDGTKLAAVVLNGNIYTSNDSGETWTASSTDTNRNWYSITSSSDGTKLAAVHYGGYIYKGVPSKSRRGN